MGSTESYTKSVVEEVGRKRWRNRIVTLPVAQEDGRTVCTSGFHGPPSTTVYVESYGPWRWCVPDTTNDTLTTSRVLPITTSLFCRLCSEFFEVIHSSPVRVTFSLRWYVLQPHVKIYPVSSIRSVVSTGDSSPDSLHSLLFSLVGHTSRFHPHTGTTQVPFVVPSAPTVSHSLPPESFAPPSPSCPGTPEPFLKRRTS